MFWAGSTRQSARHPATARFYRHSGDAGHRHLLATPAVNHRVTSNRGIESSAKAGASTPQVAGHRINPLEAPRDVAAARAQTVWASAQTPSTTLRTRRRSHRLHTSQADYPCRKRQSRLRTTQAQRTGPRDATIATRARWPGSLQRMVRPTVSHTNSQIISCGTGVRVLSGAMINPSAVIVPMPRKR